MLYKSRLRALVIIGRYKQQSVRAGRFQSAAFARGIRRAICSCARNQRHALFNSFRRKDDHLRLFIFRQSAALARSTGDKQRIRSVLHLKFYQLLKLFEVDVTRLIERRYQSGRRTFKNQILQFANSPLQRLYYRPLRIKQTYDIY